MLAIEEVKNTAVSIWNDLDEIKKVICPTLDRMEFITFVQIGKATGLNPFLKELWAVKYGNAAAQIFIGRDGYRKAAQRHPLYEFHRAEAVYSNDDFMVKNDKVEHSYKLTDRGKLLGAYCQVYRRNLNMPFYCFVNFSEYSTGKSLWLSKPETMIKKVAEAQCLRSAFQDLFSGTYCEEEQYEDKNSQAQKTISEAKSRATLSQAIEQPLTIEQQSSITPEQIEDIQNLAHEKQFPAERMTRALNYYEVMTIKELTENQANELIAILTKIESAQEQ